MSWGRREEGNGPRQVHSRLFKWGKPAGRHDNSLSFGIAGAQPQKTQVRLGYDSDIN